VIKESFNGFCSAKERSQAERRQKIFLRSKNEQTTVKNTETWLEKIFVLILGSLRSNFVQGSEPLAAE
jgi:hypothetical protein